MPSNPVVATSTLVRGTRVNFADAYKKRAQGLKERLGQVMGLDLTSDARTETYAYFESAPHMRRFMDEATFKGFLSKSFTATNHRYEVGVQWNEDDREDDQTQSLTRRAREAGANAALFHERVFFQIMLGTTDGNLLETIPNAPDGLALYSSSTRFGNSSGNIVTGSGIATADAIRGDIFNAIERIATFQDTEGQPLFDTDMVFNGGLTLFYNVNNDRLVREAVLGQRMAQVFGSNTAAAGISNIFRETGVRVNLVATQRISDNDMFLFADAAEFKAINLQTRRPLREKVITVDNDALAKRTFVEGLHYDARYGYFVFLPYGAVKIDNS